MFVAKINKPNDTNSALESFIVYFHFVEKCLSKVGKFCSTIVSAKYKVYPIYDNNVAWNKMS